MKKLFLVFAVSAFFVACNDSQTTTETETPATEEVAPPAEPVQADTLPAQPDSLNAVNPAEAPAQ